MFFPMLMITLFIGLVVSFVTENPIFVVSIPVFYAITMLIGFYVVEFLNNYLRKRKERLEKESYRMQEYISSISNSYDVVEKVIQSEIIDLLNGKRNIRKICLVDDRNRGLVNSNYSRIKKLEKKI